ncbi:MAG TPA: hypothetical protein DDW78_01980 [Treponema sp.]|nr:hypothetical protein [Treponema sp.]
MYTFLLLSIPSAVICAMVTDKSYGWASFIAPLVIGALAATAACFIKAFFIFSGHLYTEEFFHNMRYLLLHDTVLPVVLCALFFALISKDGADYKAAALFPLAGAFFAVAVPFGVLHGAERSAPFLIFVKPLLMASLAACVSALARMACAVAAQGKKALCAPLLLCAVLCLAVPPLAETAWYLQYTAWKWQLPSALLVAGAVALHLCARSMSPARSPSPDAGDSRQEAASGSPDSSPEKPQKDTDF